MSGRYWIVGAKYFPDPGKWALTKAIRVTVPSDLDNGRIYRGAEIPEEVRMYVGCTEGSWLEVNFDDDPMKMALYFHQMGSDKAMVWPDGLVMAGITLPEIKVIA